MQLRDRSKQPKTTTTTYSDRVWYLAGPMRGYKHFNFGTFLRIGAELEQMGYSIWNPAESDIASGWNPWGRDGTDAELHDFDLAQAMCENLHALMNICSGIILLPGWADSQGAKLELDTAKMLGYPVRYVRESPEGIWISGEAQYNDLEWDPDVEAQLEEAMNNDTIEWILTDFGKQLADEIAEFDEAWESSGANQCNDVWSPPADTETIVTDPVTGGSKGSKPVRLDLLPAGALQEVGRVYGYGANKYAPHNWRRGYAWSLSLAAMHRHIMAFQGGQDNDPESGYHHLAHAVFHALTLMTFGEERPELDDRYPPTNIMTYHTDDGKVWVERPEWMGPIDTRGYN